MSKGDGGAAKAAKQQRRDNQRFQAQYLKSMKKSKKSARVEMPQLPEYKPAPNLVVTSGLQNEGDVSNEQMRSQRRRFGFQNTVRGGMGSSFKAA